MLPTNIASSYLSIEVFGPIFTQFTSGRDFNALSRTCKRLSEISRSNFVIANCSLSNRQYLLQRALHSNINLMSKINTSGSDFYLVFKGACANLNIDINSKDFSHCAFVISGVYTDLPSSFLPYVYKDMLAAFADQPIEAITEDSLEEKIRDLYTFSQQRTRTVMERDVRNSLKLQKGRGFFEFAKQLQSSHHERISRIKERIKAECETEKEAILAELRILNGPSHLYGSLEASRNLLCQALTRRNNAHLAFMHVSGLRPPLNDEQFEIAIPSVKVMCAELAAANHQLEQARETCIRVFSRHDALIQRNACGQLTGGKLYRVEKRLKGIDEAAFNEFTLKVRFYFELDREVSDSNAKIRHKALQRILLDE